MMFHSYVGLPGGKFSVVVVFVVVVVVVVVVVLRTGPIGRMALKLSRAWISAFARCFLHQRCRFWSNFVHSGYIFQVHRNQDATRALWCCESRDDFASVECWPALNWRLLVNTSIPFNTLNLSANFGENPSSRELILLQQIHMPDLGCNLKSRLIRCGLSFSYFLIIIDPPNWIVWGDSPRAEQRSIFQQNRRL